MLLFHWLAHYAEQGIQLSTHAAVHLEPSGSARELEMAMAALADHGVRNVTVVDAGALGLGTG